MVTTALAWVPVPEVATTVTWSPTLNELPVGSVYKVTDTAPLASVVAAVELKL